MSSQDHGKSARPWSDIDETLVNIEKLRLLCSDQRALRKEGYIITPLDSAAVTSKLRCKCCGSRMKPPRAATTPVSQSNIAGIAVSSTKQDHYATERASKRDVCEYHPGRVVRLHYTCCQAHVSIKRGCEIRTTHTAPDNYQQILDLNWTYHRTPTTSLTIRPRPQASRRQGRARFTNLTMNQARIAVALDCEFGVSALNEPELIRMTAIDFFTKEVLIDSLVKPSVWIKNFMTRYSGVTPGAMMEAVRNRSCLFGRDAARNKLLDFVTPETIIVVHGGSSDMTSLRLIHPNILDTHILETYLDLVPGGRSLKNLCEKKLNLEIQVGRGHDSREDALACRELAIWMMEQIPDAL